LISEPLDSRPSIAIATHRSEQERSVENAKREDFAEVQIERQDHTRVRGGDLHHVAVVGPLQP
jgi:hypothetical protein